jgi:chromosome partitioning protein
MQRLVVASPKGGTGKTTIAACLAVEASLHLPRVACLDLDPQQSLAMWHSLRARVDGPELVPTGAKPGSALDRVRAQPNPPNLLIVDTPPGSVGLTRRALEGASLALITTKASPLDTEAVDIACELCSETGVPFAFLLTTINTRRNAMAAGARTFLAEKGPVLNVEITDRQAYVQAMLSGLTGPEKDKTAQAEIAALWQALEKRLAVIKGQAG